MKIYGDVQSGNCYKVQLTCHLLFQPYQWIDIDILAGDTKKTEFRQLNPAGKIPFVTFEDGRVLAESNAIINYLASSSSLIPSDAFTLAKVQQWQFFEQYSHEPFIAVNRFIQHYLKMPESRLAEYEANFEPGYRALVVMEQQLQNTSYLVGDELSTADISLFAYTHVAEEGGFDLSRFPAIQAWIARITMLPGFVRMGQGDSV